LAKKVLEDFKKYGSVKRGYIGVTFRPLDADAAQELKLSDNSGLYVSDVLPNGGGAAAGIKPGDIIKKVEGYEIYDSPDLQEKIGRMSPGDKVKLTISRNGQMKDVTVTLSGQSAISSPKTASTDKPTGTSMDKLGATFAPASPTLKAKYGVKSGVVVTSVTPGKAFDSLEIPKGLIITTINGKPVNSSQDVSTALSSSSNGMTTVSAVGPDGNYTFKF
ncbi:MAG: Serine protease, partial [Pedobacter sp.]|nr:Serine protease [Pedobacter sp.]